MDLTFKRGDLRSGGISPFLLLGSFLLLDFHLLDRTPEAILNICHLKIPGLHGAAGEAAVAWRPPPWAAEESQAPPASTGPCPLCAGQGGSGPSTEPAEVGQFTRARSQPRACPASQALLLLLGQGF